MTLRALSLHHHSIRRHTSTLKHPERRRAPTRFRGPAERWFCAPWGGRGKPESKDLLFCCLRLAPWQQALQLPVQTDPTPIHLDRFHKLDGHVVSSVKCRGALPSHSVRFRRELNLPSAASSNRRHG